MPHPLASLPCTHSAPSLPLALHFTWTTLLAQQAQVAALVDNDQRLHQAYTNLMVCASPMTISVSHSRLTLISLPVPPLTLQCPNFTVRGGGDQGALGATNGDPGATTGASSARGDATDAWVANGVRHAASGRDHATPPRIEQVALGRAHQGAPELTA